MQLSAGAQLCVLAAPPVIGAGESRLQHFGPAPIMMKVVHVGSEVTPGACVPQTIGFHPHPLHNHERSLPLREESLGALLT